VIAPAILAAVFIYWGWDTAVTTNEEADDPATTPGRAAVISTLLLLLIYALVSTAAVAFAGVGTDGIGLGNADNAGDVFRAIGPALFGDSFLGKVGLILLSASILTSASASTQTTILPTARTALSMGAYKALPNSFTRIHPRFLTPTVATVGMGVVSAVFYVLFTLVSSSLLLALIGSVGLMIAFYYGLTGFACVWFYRRTLTDSARHFLMRGALPLAGGVILFAAFIYALKNYAAADWLQDDDGKNVTILGMGAVAFVGIAALVLGFVLMLVWRVMAPDYFTPGEPLGRRGYHDLILAGVAMEDETVRLPDSGLPDIVIAPDLSNLPEGATAIDIETGEEVRRPPTE